MLRLLSLMCTATLLVATGFLPSCSAVPRPGPGPLQPAPSWGAGQPSTLAQPLWSSASARRAPSRLADEDEDDDGPGFLHLTLMYLPNRVWDLLDIVRARVRGGPGMAIGARATELADVYLGGHSSFFVGVPGPRRERDFNWPFGMDSKSGVELSVVDATAEMGMSPEYGLAEFGFGADFLILGFDVGIDPAELLDFVFGLATFDFMDDDI